VYNGTLAVAGSAVASDNKSVPVTMRVTSQPIVQADPTSLRIKIAQSTPAQTAYVSLSNRGLGALSLSGVTATTSSGGNWLSASRVSGANIVSVTADASNVAAGVYSGALTIASNAVNGTVAIPVDFQVVALGAPLAFYGGAVKNNTFESGESLPQGGIVSLFGEQLIKGAPANTPPPPLGAQLGGAQVFVNDQAVPLFYASYGQINFQMPFNTPAGDVRIRVDRDGTRGNTITARVDPAVPRIMRLGVGNYGIIVNNTDGTFPMPATPGIPSRAAKAGEALVIYALGLGPTDVTVLSGAPSPAAEPLARVSGTSVTFGGTGPFGGVPVTPLFSGLTPNYVGLYQVNVIIPDGAPRGDAVAIRVDVNAAPGNTVYLAIQ
jgi:uncharacterized protein (TIGR03437 family)